MINYELNIIYYIFYKSLFIFNNNRITGLNKLLNKKSLNIKIVSYLYYKYYSKFISFKNINLLNLNRTNLFFSLRNSNFKQSIFHCSLNRIEIGIIWNFNSSFKFSIITFSQ